MSIVFGASGGQYLVGSSNVSFPDGDWCLFSLMIINDNTGLYRSVALSSGATLNTNEITLGVIRLQADSTTQGSAFLRAAGASTLAYIRSATLDAPVGQWFYLIGQRTGSNIELLTVPIGGVSTLVDTSTAAIGAVSPGAAMRIGRWHADGDRTIHDCKSTAIAAVGWGSFALSSGQIAALAAGMPPTVIQTWGTYLPFMSLRPTYSAPIGGGTYTVTGFPTEGAQPVRLW